MIKIWGSRQVLPLKFWQDRRDRYATGLAGLLGLRPSFH